VSARRIGAWLALVGAGAVLAACASKAGAPETAPADAPAPTPTAPTGASAPSTATPAASAIAPTQTPETDTGNGQSVTISAVGDVSLARQVNDWMEQYGAGYPYELVRPLITGDIGFANLEGALTDRGEPWPKGFNFRTPPKFASGLREAGFDVVSVGNNHTMDYGVDGLLDTVSALNSAGIGYSGAGEQDVAAWRGALVEPRPGVRVAFISCVATPAEGTGFSIDQWAAGSANPSWGVAICGAGKIAEAVAAERGRAADFVVVSMHAGDEYVTAPNATQRELAEAALAAGADVVLGHHAHVVQPVEQRGGQLIAWGLGNFIFDLDQWDLAGIPEPRVSLILNITLTKGAGVTVWEAVPVVLDAEQDRPRPATAEEAAVLRALLVP
jgi:poly-gamma-glutamate synthesis protein (capsule biosynthesis protein)